MKYLIEKIIIAPRASIKEALKKIDTAGLAMLFVCDEKGIFLGSLSDGDIRRKVLKTGNLQEDVSDCYNSNAVSVNKNYIIDEVKKIMIEKTIEVIPVLDEKKRIVDILFWTDIFEKSAVTFKQIDIPIVIMAGGKGERLSPFTKIFPKPLIPISEKPIIEIIIDKFRQYGVTNFYVTLNYKGEMIRTYLESIERDYKINYVWEEDFLGTAGSLRLMPHNLYNTWMVSNCDIIVDVNCVDLLQYHQESKNLLTVVGSIQYHKIPYGVIDFEDGRIQKIREKPEYDFTINTGVYVLNNEAINFIPKNKSFDMTNLIQVLLDKEKRVGIYPVSQKSYIDIGQWEEYKKVIDKFQLF